MSSRLLAAVIVVVLGSAACASADDVPTEIESADPVPTTTGVDTDDGESDDGESDDGDPDEGDPDEGDPDDGDPDDGESDDGESDDGDPDDGESDDGGDGPCGADEAPDGGIYFVVGIGADDPDGGLIVRAFGSPTAPERGVLKNGTDVQTFTGGLDDDGQANCVVLDGGSVWWEVAHRSLAVGGWVNSGFLSKTVSVDAFAEAFVSAVMDGDDATIAQLAAPDIADVFTDTGGFSSEDGHGVESIQITSDTDFSFSWGPTLTAACEISQGVISSCSFGE